MLFIWPKNDPIYLSTGCDKFMGSLQAIGSEIPFCSMTRWGNWVSYGPGMIS